MSPIVSLSFFLLLRKGMLSLHTGKEAHQVGGYLGFCSIKRLRVFLPPLDGMLVSRKATLALNSPVPSEKLGWREVL